MTNRMKENRLPTLRIDRIALVSLWYRSTQPGAELVLDSKASMELKGNVRYYFLKKRKYSFKMRVTNEIQVEVLSFRARHEVDIESDSPLSKDLYQNEEFVAMAINRVMPFCSEIFAYLSGKTLVVPIIAPSELPEEGEQAEV